MKLRSATSFLIGAGLVLLLCSPVSAETLPGVPGDGVPDIVTTGPGVWELNTDGAQVQAWSLKANQDLWDVWDFVDWGWWGFTPIGQHPAGTTLGSTTADWLAEAYFNPAGYPFGEPYLQGAYPFTGMDFLDTVPPTLNWGDVLTFAWVDQEDTAAGEKLGTWIGEGGPDNLPPEFAPGIDGAVFEYNAWTPGGGGPAWFELLLEATDPDDDDLTFSIVDHQLRGNAPEMQGQGHGRNKAMFRYNAGHGAYGPGNQPWAEPLSVTVEVSDGKGKLIDTATFTLQIVPEPSTILMLLSTSVLGVLLWWRRRK